MSDNVASPTFFSKFEMGATTELAFVSPIPLTSAINACTSLSRLSQIAPRTCRASLKPMPTSEPSYPIPLSPALPPSLNSTTIYHTIPSVPKHHANCDELTHRNDGDAFILAISFPTEECTQCWIRGRFVRTSPFYVEALQKKRIYRGTYGSPGSVGINAPVKPKASSAKGVFMRCSASNQCALVAFGIRSLPFSVNPDSLATKGPTALGTVLSDSDELVGERPLEVSVPPVTRAQRIFTIGVSRTSVGKIADAFISELDLNYNVLKRYPRISVPPSCDVVAFTVCDQFCVYIIHRLKEESGGFLSPVFGTGKRKQAPVVDIEFGTVFAIVSRDSGASATCRLPNILCTQLISVSAKQFTLQIEAIELTRNDQSLPVRLSTIADAKSGHLWHSCEPDWPFSTQLTQVTMNIENSTNAMTINAERSDSFQIAPGVMVLDCPSQSSHPLESSLKRIYTIFDTAKNCSGIAVCEDASICAQKWFAGSSQDVITGAALSPCQNFVAVLLTNDHMADTAAELLVLEVGTIENGPVTTIGLSREKFGSIGSSVGSVWTDHAAAWSVKGGKPAKSSYEIFNSRDWNDINSGFSGLGF